MRTRHLIITALDSLCRESGAWPQTAEVAERAGVSKKMAARQLLILWASGVVERREEVPRRWFIAEDPDEKLK